MFRVDLFSYFFLCFSVLFSVSGFISVCFSARALHGEFLEKSVQLFPENNGVPKRKASKSTFQDHWEKLKLSSEMERVLNDAHEPIHLRGFGEFDEEELREIISEKASNLPSWGVYNLVELTKLKIVLSLSLIHI